MDPQDSSERYRRLFDDLPVGVAVLRPEGDAAFRIVELNRAGARMIGAAGVPVPDLPLTEEPALVELLRAVLTTGQERHWSDYPTRRVPGILFALKAVRLDEGSVAVSFEDVTARKAAEEALRRSEEQLRLMVDAVQDYAIFRLDPEGRIVSWNRGAQKITGYRVVDILGRPVDVLSEPADALAGRPAEFLRRAAREGRASEEGWRVRADGTRFWTHSTLTALLADDGRLRGFVKILHDGTERRRARRALEEKSAALEAANAELTEFATVASHDLQAPLRKAAAFARQLEIELGPRMDAAEKDLARRMNAALEGMQSLIESLLDLARAGASAMRTEEVDLADLAREAAAEAGAAPGAVSIEALPRARGDREQLRQLLRNLLANALKFHRPGEPPVVRVRGVVRPDLRVEVRVEDDGVGFDMDQAGRLFQPFQRLHGRKDFEGSGMGLAICRKIVLRHGGTIAIESAPGRGTAVTAVLPGAERPREAKAGSGGASWNRP